MVSLTMLGLLGTAVTVKADSKAYKALGIFTIGVAVGTIAILKGLGV